MKIANERKLYGNQSGENKINTKDRTVNGKLILWMSGVAVLERFLID